MSTDDALPRASDGSLDAAADHASQAAAMAPVLPGQSDNVQRRVSDALALAERFVRWEDDVPLAELAMFARLYMEVLRLAREELGEAPISAVSTLATLPAEEARTELLRLRLEAHVWARKSADHQRASAPAASATRLRWQHWLIGAAVLLGIGTFAARNAIVDQLDLGNVSQGKRWVASSAFSANVRASGTLGDFSMPFFFHTALESNPWIEVDLGGEIEIGSLTVINRTDCCANRGVPLVVETSDDHKTWQVAATRQQSFAVWRPRLGKRARWIRLRVLRESTLHLQSLIIRS